MHKSKIIVFSFAKWSLTFNNKSYTLTVLVSNLVLRISILTVPNRIPLRLTELYNITE